MYNEPNKLNFIYEVNIMKKVLAVFATLALIATLSACSNGKKPSTTDPSEKEILTVTDNNTEESTVPESDEQGTYPKTTGSVSKPTETTSTTAKEIVTVTIPEGFTFPQIAKRLESKGICSAQSFYEAAEAFKVQSFTVPSSDSRCFNLEGYLFPATYEFEKGADPTDVVRKMLNAYAGNSGKPSDETLILASIIEKEVRSDEQMQMVASVLKNRLSAGMKLQCDSTREYVNANITGSPFLASTEKFAALYNTYKCPALPAGPICNPGKRAINAAQNPAQSDYLYFFFGNDNQNHYSKTLEEHEAQKAQYGVNFGS